MATTAELLAAIDNLKPPSAPEPMSLGDKVMGYSRSYLNGPLFGFEPQIEAGIANMINPGTYDQELSQIKDDQSLFKKENPITGYGTEIASSILLNPLDKLNKISQGANYGLTTLGKVISNPLSQGAIAGVGNKSDDETVAGAALKGSMFGAGGSAAASIFGKVAQTAAKGAENLKLSAFGITASDINRMFKKAGTGTSGVADLPIVKTVQGAEKAGIIDAGNSVVENMNGVLGSQNKIASKLTDVLDTVDAVLPPDRNFKLNNTIDFIEGLSGTARQKADDAAMLELEAITKQFENGGTLADLQKAKIGLNYKFDQNPYAEDVIKSIRSDLRAEIEHRTNTAAHLGLVSPAVNGAVKDLNSKWGNLAELKDAFARKVSKDFGPDVVEGMFNGMKTTGGTGSLNIMSAASGNPMYAAAGVAANAARAPEAKSRLADMMMEVKKPLGVVGDVLSGDAQLPGGLGTLPAPITARSAVQMMDANKGEPTDLSVKGVPKPESYDNLKSISQQLDGLATQKKQTEAAPKTGASIGQALSGIFGGKSSSDKINAIDGGTMPADFKDIEAQIDSDPVDSAIYQAESNRNPAAKNKVSSASGGFQLTSKTAKDLGVKDVFDLAQNYDGYKKLKDENVARFGNDPAMIYSAHYLGATVLNKVLNNKPLSTTEQAQVDYLRKKALPDFLKIYQSKLGSDYSEA